MNGKEGRKIFPALNEAKQIAFEIIENGTADNYLKKHGAPPAGEAKLSISKE